MELEPFGEATIEVTLSKPHGPPLYEINGEICLLAIACTFMHAYMYVCLYG